MPENWFFAFLRFNGINHLSGGFGMPLKASLRRGARKCHVYQAVQIVDYTDQAGARITPSPEDGIPVRGHGTGRDGRGTGIA